MTWVARGAVAVILLGAVAVPDVTHAQAGAGIGITPAIIEEAASQGETKQYTVTISNLSDQNQKYFVFVRDIVGVKDDSSPVYATEGVESTGYEISSWITLEKGEIDIPARTSAPLSFVMQVPADASPGSHFGAVFVSVESPRMRSTGASVGYEVANIVSIRVAGEADVRAEIREFSTNRFIHGATDIDFSLSIQNSGNVLVRPTGPVEITNMFGKQVALLAFNESQASVFPGVTRDYVFNWQDDGVGFGRYEARVSPIYGEAGNKQTLSSTVSFWILPMNIIGPSLTVLVVLLAAVYLGIRLYVRRTVALLTSGGGERRIVRTVRRRGQPVVFMTLVAMLATTVLFLILLLLIFA